MYQFILLYFFHFSVYVFMIQDLPPIIYPHKQEIRDKILLLSLRFAPFFPKIHCNFTNKKNKATHNHCEPPL